MKFSTGNNFAVIMTSPFTSKSVVTYATEAEAVEEAAKAQEKAYERGYTDIHYEVEKVGAA